MSVAVSALNPSRSLPIAEEVVKHTVAQDVVWSSMGLGSDS